MNRAATTGSRKANLIGLTFACALLLTFSNPAQAQSTAAAKDLGKHPWPQFLGPQRNGISSETGLVDSWPEGGPKKAWRAPGGVGMSGLVVDQGNVLTLVQREGKQWLVALDAKSGQPRWQTALAPAFTNGRGNGPRATPAIAGSRVFAFTGEGILAAVQLSDGKLLWSHNLVEELHGEPAEYGMACSPLVVGANVIVTVGAPQATLAALNVATGKLAWTAGDEATGYSSPALLEVGGKRQVVAFTGSAVLGLSGDTGSELWRFPFVTDFDCNVATPVSIAGQVFVSAGENHGSALLKLQPQGDKFEVDTVWESLGPKSTLRNEWQTSVVLDGYLYGFDNVGGAGPVTHLTCVNAATGERAWQQPRFGKGNLIAADGKLLISTMAGELVLVRATPKKFEELGRAVVLGTTRQAPALADGLVYLRDDREIVCLDLRK